VLEGFHLRQHQGNALSRQMLETSVSISERTFLKMVLGELCNYARLPNHQMISDL
jgi:hypothetical protein